MTLPAGSQVGNILPVPAVDLVPAIGAGWQAGFTTDDELLYSTVGYTQKGVTLKAGQGILPLGTVLGRVTATKLYVAYSQGASDGSQVPRGILRTAVDTGLAGATKGYLANIVIMGLLKLTKVSGADANAITVLQARTDAVMGTFRF